MASELDAGGTSGCWPANTIWSWIPRRITADFGRFHFRSIASQNNANVSKRSFSDANGDGLQ